MVKKQNKTNKQSSVQKNWKEQMALKENLKAEKAAKLLSLQMSTFKYEWMMGVVRKPMWAIMVSFEVGPKG